MEQIYERYKCLAETYRSNAESFEGNLKDTYLSVAARMERIADRVNTFNLDNFKKNLSKIKENLELV